MAGTSIWGADTVVQKPFTGHWKMEIHSQEHFGPYGECKYVPSAVEDQMACLAEIAFTDANGREHHRELQWYDSFTYDYDRDGNEEYHEHWDPHGYTGEATDRSTRCDYACAVDYDGDRFAELYSNGAYRTGDSRFHGVVPVQYQPVWDNCLNLYNPDQADRDNDGEGDACDDGFVEKRLIVSIGDSVASGEGNPPNPCRDQIRAKVPKPWNLFIAARPVLCRDRPTDLWNGSENAQCHRSPLAGPAVAASLLPRDSVEFVHLACSGATIKKGLIGSYKGIDPKQGPPLAPQLDQITARGIDPTQIDALLVSIGANDLGFGAIVQKCALESAPGPLDNVAGCQIGGAGRIFKKKIGTLVGWYRDLHEELDAMGIPDERVYITELFNPLRDTDGGYCSRLLATIARPSVKWAEQTVLRRLNEEVSKAARKWNWNYVGGIESSFRLKRAHGMCSKSNSWIVKPTESFRDQGDHNGILHPNEKGHYCYGRRIAWKVAQDLFPEHVVPANCRSGQ